MIPKEIKFNLEMSICACFVFTKTGKIQQINSAHRVISESRKELKEWQIIEYNLIIFCNVCICCV